MFNTNSSQFEKRGILNYFERTHRIVGGMSTRGILKHYRSVLFSLPATKNRLRNSFLLSVHISLFLV